MSTTKPPWRKSSYSGSEGDNCVEVAIHANAVHIRDSKNADMNQLTFPNAAWTNFIEHATGAWRKSSYSGGGGDNCVEVAVTRAYVRVRDSKDEQIDQLTLSHIAWAEFTRHIVTTQP
ncbi:DUF397 domain-containing protein [Streptomyces sp. NPDC003077]|uniref:DUF397 domain-containing protein n=1 Tax=Streptomyces sp. NPDC003077 TaxID=3154443 RepID=UPI0033BC4A13